MDENEKEAERRIQQAKETNASLLDLSGLKLTSVPDTIGQLTQLILLKLSNNELTTLPDAIVQLTQLIGLDLSDNQLTTLPDTIGQLTQLTRLYLINNKLTTFPEAIGQLTQLTHLYLRNNPLHELPTSTQRLKHLKRCDFRNIGALPTRLKINECQSALRYLQRQATATKWEHTVGLENQFLARPKKSILGLVETLLCTALACGYLATVSHPLWWLAWASGGWLLLLRSEPSTHRSRLVWHYE